MRALTDVELGLFNFYVIEARHMIGRMPYAVPRTPQYRIWAAQSIVLPALVS